MNFPDRLFLNVTEECIELGTPRNCFACPLVKAAEKHWPGANIAVGVTGMRVVCALPSWRNAKYELPEEAHEFMANFDQEDRRHLAVPFTCQIVRK